MVFIALVMSRFDIRLAEKEQATFPKLDTRTPSLGVMMPMAGEDVQVVVRKRGPDLMEEMSDRSLVNEAIVYLDVQPLPSK